MSSLAHRWAGAGPLLALAAVAAFAASAVGQVRVPSGVAVTIAEESAGMPARVHPPTDRALSRGMRRAAGFIEAGEFSQALAFLDEILARDEDFFSEGSAEGRFIGIKELARRLIRDLPAEGRRTYEITYGPVAERLLREAATQGDAAGLQHIVQRYFYTSAGFQAALLLAAGESDAGRHLSAALVYQELLDVPEARRQFDPQLTVLAAASWLAAEDPHRAEQLLASLDGRGRQALTVAGREHSLGDLSHPLQWLASTVGEPSDSSAPPERQWLTYRGNASRNAATEGGLPHMRVRWRTEMLRPYARLEQLFEEFRADLQRSGQAMPVASAPLAVGDYILVRRPMGLLAVDYRTGKRVWQSELKRDPKLEQLVNSGAGPQNEAAIAEPAQAFARQMWQDYLYGVMSSDGERVFAIRDLPLPSAQDFEMPTFMGAPVEAPSNRLTAYDLATEGALAWEIDGAAATGELAGAFFLGAPLAMGPSLFVLVEIRDDIHLASLNRLTGALEWRQQLANLETGVRLDLRRRLQAAMPSYDNGILVCPTGAGLVVGVDLAKRSLAWAYRYNTLPPFDGVVRIAPTGGGSDAAGAGQWTDCGAVIADGRILMTPPESGELHCLDLRTGELLWKQPRGEMQRLACVEDGRILLVGAAKLRSIRLEDGASAWPDDGDVELPADAAPAGNGFVSGGKYFFPLTTSEVIAVDLAQGTVQSRVQSRDGAALGNLICHRGSVISQNGLFLDCFDQVDALRTWCEDRLASHPNDAEALRKLGEIAYNDDRLSDAIDLVERSYQGDPDDLETREMLAECLADALDSEFTAYRTRLPLLEELGERGAIGPLRLLQIKAQGLLDSGDPLGSAEACLQLYRTAGRTDDLLQLRRGHRALVSRWVRSQWSAAWDAATEEGKAVLAEQLRNEARDLELDQNQDRLERFLAFFGSAPNVDDLKLIQARRLVAAKRNIEAQQLLLDLTHAADEAIRREAVARVASQLHAANQHLAAREFDQRLASEFADAVCLDGATGQELVERWSEAAQDSFIDWPTGAVHVRTVPVSGGSAASRARAPVWSVRLEQADSVLASGAGSLAMRGGELTWSDGYGREFFSVGMESESQAFYRQTGSIYGSSRGNLLVVSLGRELAAYNTLGSDSRESSPLLWRANLGSNFEYQDVYIEELTRATESRAGSYRAPRMVLNDRWVGVIGPITSLGCIYQDQRRLSCVDPITGELKWSRDDAPPGCDLFGDDRYVFATPKGSTRAIVYSTIDGRELGTAEVPPWTEQVTTRGRVVIRWSKNDAGGLSLVAQDALTGQVEWRQDFAAQSRIDIDADRYIAVVEPTGRLVILDAADGTALSEQALPKQPPMDEVHLLAGTESFVIVIDHASTRAEARQVRAFYSGETPVIDGQVLVIDRSENQVAWSRPVTVARQALLIDAPRDLPFITFAGTLVSRGPSEGPDKMTLLLVDKATGRSLYSEDGLPLAGAGYCGLRVSNAAEREVTVDMATRALVMKFTGDRRPPEPPALADVETESDRASGGLIGIIRNLGGVE